MHAVRRDPVTTTCLGDRVGEPERNSSHVLAVITCARIRGLAHPAAHVLNLRQDDPADPAIVCARNAICWTVTPSSVSAIADLQSAVPDLANVCLSVPSRLAWTSDLPRDRFALCRGRSESICGRTPDLSFRSRSRTANGYRRRLRVPVLMSRWSRLSGRDDSGYTMCRDRSAIRLLDRRGGVRCRPCDRPVVRRDDLSPSLIREAPTPGVSTVRGAAAHDRCAADHRSVSAVPPRSPRELAA